MKKFCVVLALVLVVSGLLPAFAYKTEKQEIQDVVSIMEIMQGYPGGDFGYYDNLTRAQFAKIVIKMTAQKDSVPAQIYTSPFKDVPYTHWAAPYVDLAARQGFMRGYVDGSFKPDQNVLYEEAVITLLRMLGYTATEYGNSYPHSQIAFASSLDMDDRISGVAGQAINREQAMYMIYNTLLAKPNGQQTAYVSSFGYKTNKDGIDYTDFIEQNSEGPVILRGNMGIEGTKINMGTAKIYKNGKASTLSALGEYDVAYYAEGTNTVWVYSNKVTGVYQSAAPYLENPSSVTINGVTYQIETPQCAKKFAVGGEFVYGDVVTLLLGRDGRVCDVIPVAQLKNEVYGVMLDGGKKSYTDGNQVTTSSFYGLVLQTTGETVEYQLENDPMYNIGNPVKITFNNSKARVSSVSATAGISGKFSQSAMTIGTARLASDVNMLDADKHQNSLQIYPARLDGVNITSDKVWFYTKNKEGQIDNIIFKNLTNDTYSYGMVTKVTESKTEAGLSSSYNCNVDGQDAVASFQNAVLNLKIGPAMFIKEKGQIVDISMLWSLNKTIASVEGNWLETTDGERYMLADNVCVYSQKGSNVRIPLEQLQKQDFTKFTAYYDKEQDAGGRIRVIMAK